MSKLAEILESGRAPGFHTKAQDPTDADIAVPRALKQLEQTMPADKIVMGMGWKPTGRNLREIKRSWKI